MDGQKTAGSVFMCRLCNLFSPTRSLLLAHCSEMHPLHEPNEDIIVALQPLARVPLETLTESPVKRKRGRPKGSTKKPRTDCTNTREDSAQGPLDKAQRQERQKEVADAHGGNDRISGLKCNDCHRLFSNRRQIVKHICLKAPDEEEEEEEEDGIGDICRREEVEDPRGADPNQSQQIPKSSGTKRRKRTRSFQRPRPNKKSRMLSDDGERHTSKEDSLATGSKKSVINVVLTEDDLLPGVTKMIPVENISTGADHVNIPGESQIQNTEATQGEPTDIVSQSQPTPCDEDPKADQELSSDKATPPPGKGFQEYSIKQDAPNLLQSQLKVFACEFCNKIFKFRHSLISHLRTHTQEKPFKCPHCDYASAIKANLNVHLRKHTGEKFSCQQCPFQCLSPGHLKVHIERVHLKLKQHCSYCQKKYSDVKNLIKHFEKCHNLKDPLIYKSYQQLRLKTRQGLRQLLYHCPTCHRRFKNLLERERHLLVHGPQRPFACLLCEHAGTSLATLTAHVRKHPFLYVCCACEKKFVSCQRLKSHLTECHSDLEQEQVFTECIKNSFYLMSGAGSLSGDEEREDTERSKKLEDNSREEGRRNGDDGQEWREGEDEERENEGIQFQGEDVEAQRTSEGCTQKSEPKNIPEAQQCAVPSETNNMTDHNKQGHTPHMENTPTNPNTQLADDNTQVSSLLLAENKNLPSAPSGEDHQSPQSDKGLQLSAFQQVLSSLPKTHLDMETFQRLRKMYGDLECQYCGKLFWYKVHYNAHVRTHTKEHLHYCSKCNYSSITKSSLKRHLIQKHSGLLLTCSNPGCKYTTPDKYKLQAHRRTHQEECKSAPCPTCHQNYPEHRLRRHIQMSHPDTIPVKGLMVKRAEKCPYCESYYLKNSSDFQQHIWAHQGVKPFVCNICDYASRSRNNLKNHMNRHNKERCHVCDLCGKTLKSKVSLKSHRLSHTDEGKRFRCPECDFTSALKAPLVRHMEQHAEFKPFRCAHCHYSCNTSGPLKRHYKTKHPDQKYQNVGKGFSDPEYSRQGGIKCPECRFVYGTKWELNRHLKKKHGPKQVECTWEVEETVETHFVPLEQEEQLTEENVAALQDNGPVNILQQIAEFNSETHDAITSMVAMAPGTVAVVEQVEGEKEVDDSQLMVVNADGDLTGEQVMVVEEGHGLEALTVLTQGDSNHHFIVYVQEQTVEIN